MPSDLVLHSDQGTCTVCFLNPPIPLDGDSAMIRNFGQNDTNHSRNGKSTVDVPRS